MTYTAENWEFIKRMDDLSDVSDTVFSKLHFEKQTYEYMAYGKYDCYKSPAGSFYMLEEVPGLQSYVIESADNEYEASHGIFEDSGLFDMNQSYDELAKEVYRWLITYAE